MNRKLLIIGGVILICIVLGIWVYLMLYGVPKSSDEIFANLGFGSGPIADTLPEPEVSTPTIIDTEPAPPEALRQLTVRPVAGATIIAEEGIYYARYVERGTGHIYEINLTTQNENRISGTTFTKITDAVFAPDGQSVALISHDVEITETTIGILNSDRSGEESVTTIPLPNDIENITFSEDSSAVRFTISDFGGTRGYQQPVQNEAERALLFNIPISSVIMNWARDAETYVSTKPATQLDGYIFGIRDGQLERITSGGPGLLALTSEGYIITTILDAGTPLTRLIERETSTESLLPIIAIDTKCSFSNTSDSTLWCAEPISDFDADEQSLWYQGKTTLTDRLWKINLTDQTATLRSNFNIESGRTIDVTNLTHSDAYVLFINRIDETLWVFNDII